MMINPFKLRRRRRHGARCGATAIEFAMVAPAFLMVITVCAEFSRMCILRNTTQNACYESARFIITEGATVADGIERANAILGRLGNVHAEITINGSDGSTNGDGDVIGEIAANESEVTVQILIYLKDVAVILPGSFFGENTIGAQMTLRTERYRGFYDSTSAD